MTQFDSVTIEKSLCDDFPSLLTANASIAIIIDREYLDNKYENILNEIKVIIERVLREDLKNGGLIVSYYSWTRINLKKDFTAVLSITNCENTWEIFEDSRSEYLLLMAITDPDCPRLPYDEAIMAMLLYDNTFDRDMISRCVNALSRDFPDESGDLVKPLSVSIYRIKDSPHEWDRRKMIRTMLKQLPTKFIGKNFMVLVTAKLMQSLMEIARDLKMVDTFSQWFYVVSDTSFENHNISFITTLIEEGNNIAFILNHTRGGNECVSGIECHSNELLKSFVLGLSKAIREEAAVYGQISDEEWEIIRASKKERRNDILNFMLDNLRKTSKCAACTTWNVKSSEIWGNQYKYSAFSDGFLKQVSSDGRDSKETSNGLKMIDAGFWKPFDGLKMTDALFPHVSHGFRNKQFKVITYHNPPWQYVINNESGIVGMPSGVVFDILNEVSKKLNFSYVIHLAQVSTATNITDANGTVTKDIHLLTTDIPTEVLSLLSENHIILGAVANTINERYKRLINFSVPISIQPYSFLVAKPKEISRIYLFAAPFTTLTWLCLAGMIVILPPVLCIVNRLSPFYEFHRHQRTLGLFKIDNCFWYIYGALLQQGGLYLPHADSGRIIIGSWWLIVIVLVTTYCGNLVAFLTFPKIDNQIKTVDELVKHHKSVTWGMRGGTYLEDYIRDTDIHKYQLLYSGANFYPDENEEIIENVRKGKHVYIDWRSNLKQIMRREHLKTESCDFSLSFEEFMEEQIGIVFPMNSPYLDLFNIEITRLHQMGLIERWMKQYMPQKDRCSKQSTVIEVINHTVNMDDMQGCFLVLLFGFSAGFFFFLFEGILQYYRKFREKDIIEPYVD
ncbi:CLUMA_CG020350, isoform A [Clunio marinus]|uniref:CLUMA_CG020350, isoform A n=1 Tax=Clunio marinus TaxID=568069 RepID=A0A1J1J4N3_9DIPT|nr:CLUMA_CG020350, isoform A [Clunio marinus]